MKMYISLLQGIPGTSQGSVPKDIGNPSWKRPLPHVLVATLSSFLFGYHLGFVQSLWSLLF